MLEFADGGRMALRDKRRLGRARDRARLRPRRPGRRRGLARRVPRARRPRHDRAEGAAARSEARSPASATCWPTRRCGRRGSRPAPVAGELSDEELDHLRRVLRAATRAAIRKGGVHTGDFITHPQARRAVPALRDDARARDDRRPYDVLVPEGADLGAFLEPSEPRLASRGAALCSRVKLRARCRHPALGAALALAAGVLGHRQLQARHASRCPTRAERSPARHEHARGGTHGFPAGFCGFDAVLCAFVFD